MNNLQKSLLTIAIVLGIALGGIAQDRGLFNLAPQNEYDTYDSYNRDGGLVLPSQHGGTSDQGAPLGSGALLLIGFGAAYALKKKKEK